MNRPLSRGRALVCLVLAVLFLYNPFLVTPGPSGTLSACRARSFRGTVASCELLTLKRTDSREAITITASDLPEILTLPQPQLWFVAERVPSEDALPNDDLLSGSLWFRPPPVA